MKARDVKTGQFSVRLSEADATKVSQLEKHYGLSSSDLFRLLVRAEHYYVMIGGHRSDGVKLALAALVKEQHNAKGCPRCHRPQKLAPSGRLVCPEGHVYGAAEKEIS